MYMYMRPLRGGAPAGAARTSERDASEDDVREHSNHDLIMISSNSSSSNSSSSSSSSYSSSSSSSSRSIVV